MRAARRVQPIISPKPTSGIRCFADILGRTSPNVTLFEFVFGESRDTARVFCLSEWITRGCEIDEGRDVACCAQVQNRRASLLPRSCTHRPQQLRGSSGSIGLSSVPCPDTAGVKVFDQEGGRDEHAWAGISSGCLFVEVPESVRQCASRHAPRPIRHPRRERYLAEGSRATGLRFLEQKPVARDDFAHVRAIPDFSVL
jgi:hypothetical protein